MSYILKSQQYMSVWPWPLRSKFYKCNPVFILHLHIKFEDMLQASVFSQLDSCLLQGSCLRGLY